LDDVAAVRVVVKRCHTAVAWRFELKIPLDTLNLYGQEAESKDRHSLGEEKLREEGVLDK